mgnify:CR=1 FL=1
MILTRWRVNLLEQSCEWTSEGEFWGSELQGTRRTQEAVLRSERAPSTGRMILVLKDNQDLTNQMKSFHFQGRKKNSAEHCHRFLLLLHGWSSGLVSSLVMHRVILLTWGTDTGAAVEAQMLKRHRLGDLAADSAGHGT